jgi:small-conductance mechanosensitive channel
VARRRKARAQRTEADFDNLLVDLADRSKLFLLLFPALYLGARFLIVPRELGRLLRMLAEVASVAQIALWLSAVVDFWIARYRRTRATTDPSASATMNIFRLGAVVAIWLVAALVAIENLGFNVTTVVASLGIGGVAVALALQNILGDLFASLSIIIDKPFVVGDSISVDEHSGTVEHIGMKTTRLRSVNGEELIISNGDLLKSRIRNFHRMVQRRAIFRFAVRLEVAPEKLERVPDLVRAIVEQQPHAKFDRAHFIAIGETGFEFEVVYFVESPDYAVFADVRQRVNVELVRALAAEEIAFAARAPRVLP